MDRIEQSKHVILQNQAPNGALIASPSFPHYHYSWLRDGTFIAYGLDCIGVEGATHFYRWANETIERYRDKALQAIQHAKEGRLIPREFLLHTRYTIEGAEVEGEWGTFQLDGYGTLLWGMVQHTEIWENHCLLIEFESTIQMITEYLLLLWKGSCFDCWEEYGDYTHPATIAAIYGGIHAVLPILNKRLQLKAKQQLEEMKNFLLQQVGTLNHFPKSVGIPEIDASLIWLHTPYQVFDSHHSVMKETIRKIETKLLVNGGVHRYPQDTYYGGGQWVLLSGFLGWYYLEIGEIEKAKSLLEWIEQQFDELGYLPEQVQHNLLSSDYYSNWLQRWGQPAKPLLWSHAMYLILRSKLAHTEDIEKEEKRG
ncbi:MAG TPA: glycoside hydrolase family 15 protein [Bacillota bacterium]|nr:glycoside hydrolase family 15 protein [Bacillota bacterium]